MAEWGSAMAESEKKHVMVVDDEAKIAQLLKTYLESFGYEVEMQYSGMAALDAAKEHQPDLVILDLKLPDISGFEVSDHLREVYSQDTLPILMLTSMDRAEDREKGFEHGANAYMGKPFDFSEVVLQVENLLKGAGPALA